MSAQWNPLIVAALKARGFEFEGEVLEVNQYTGYTHPKIPCFKVKTAKPESSWARVNPDKFVLYVEGGRYQERVQRRSRSRIERKLIDCTKPRWEAQLATWWTYATFEKLRIDRTYAEADAKVESVRRLKQNAEEALVRAVEQAGLTQNDSDRAGIQLYCSDTETILRVGRAFIVPTQMHARLGQLNPDGLAKAFRLAAFLKSEGWQ